MWEIYTCQRMSSYRFLKRYPKDKLVMVGQDRNQSITSRSTVATFLDIKRN